MTPRNRVAITPSEDGYNGLNTSDDAAHGGAHKCTPLQPILVNTMTDAGTGDPDDFYHFRKMHERDYYNGI
jgi:hypothetical protein